MNTSRILPLLLIPGVIFAIPACTSQEPNGEHPYKHETAGQYIDDATITTRVKAAIFSESGLKSTEIDVKTYNGVVQLSGFVSSQADIDRAMDIARKVEGVTSVNNDMRLK